MVNCSIAKRQRIYQHLATMGVVAIGLAAATVTMTGQEQGRTQEKSWAPTRTAWGDPDIQGIWRPNGGLAFERPEEYQGRAVLTDAEVAAKLKGQIDRQEIALAGKATNRGFRAQENYNSIFNTSDEMPVLERINRRTSAIVDPGNGLLPPWTLEQVKRWDEREKLMVGRGEGESWEDVNVGGRCIADLDAPKVPAWGLGFGGINTAYGGRDAKGENVAITNGDGIDPGANAGGNRRLLQTPGFVTIVNEEQGEYTIIPLDGRPAPGARIAQWRGVPRGHWEGNTLVVITTNVRYGYPLIPNAGFTLYPASGESLTLVERFTRTGPDTMEYRYTVTDPTVYVRPYTVLHDLRRDESYKMAPDLCQENNRDMGGLLANARADDQQSLENGAESIAMRKPRIDQLRKEAEEYAKKNGGSR